VMDRMGSGLHPVVGSSITDIELLGYLKQTKQIPWLLIHNQTIPSDHHWSANFRADCCRERGCHMVGAADPPMTVNLSFVDRSCYFFFQVAPHLSSQGCVDPVPDSLLLRKSGTTGNQINNNSLFRQKKNTNSVALSPQVGYTDRAGASCRRS
jgi:hypothetical protein